MFRARCFLFLSLSLLGGCKKAAQSTDSSQSPTKSFATPQPAIDACSLLTKEEVGVAQNTTISEARSSSTTDGARVITQCYYASTGLNLSVSLSLTQQDSNSPAAASPREYWAQIFRDFGQTAGAEDAEKKKEAADQPNKPRGEEEEKRIPPKKIDGIGDEAFWSGNRFGGALYVLKRNAFLRISVGGPDTEETKIERSELLAKKTLERLP